MKTLKPKLISSTFYFSDDRLNEWKFQFHFIGRTDALPGMKSERQFRMVVTKNDQQRRTAKTTIKPSEKLCKDVMEEIMQMDSWEPKTAGK